MSSRRTALDVLTRLRLRQIAGRAGIDFKSSASRTEMLDKLSRSHSIPLKTLLTDFLRDELKLACQRLELDHTGRERIGLIKRIVAAERLSRKKRAESSSATKAKVQTSIVSRSRGTSKFLEEVAAMEEPRIVPSIASTPAGAAAEPDRDGVFLNWGGKRTEVDRIVLPFQRIEVVNESRATREAEKGTFSVI